MNKFLCRVKQCLSADHPSQKLLGLTKNRLAFYYSGYQLRGGDAWLSADEAKQKAEVAVDEAIELFKQVRLL